LAEDVRVELGLTPKQLKSLRAPLERCGAVVAARVRPGPDEDYVTELARWDHVHPEPYAGGGLEELVAAGVRAAVVAPEREPKRWFSWSWYWDDELIDRLVDGGRLYRPEPGWIAAR